jgi:hypothetical protein
MQARSQYPPGKSDEHDCCRGPLEMINAALVVPKGNTHSLAQAHNDCGGDEAESSSPNCPQNPVATGATCHPAEPAGCQNS